jgi:hypothetical protein
MLKTGTRTGVLNRRTQKRYSKGVLEHGYSKRGTRQGVLEHGCSTRVLKKGAQKGVLENGNSKGVLKKGYSRIFNGAEKLLRVLAAVHCGVLAGSARQCWAHRSNGPCGMAVYIGYSRRTPTTGALVGGSGRRLLRAYAPALRVGCDRSVPTVCFQRTYLVLPWYSRGALTVLRHPVGHAALLRARVAVAVGLGSFVPKAELG